MLAQSVRLAVSARPASFTRLARPLYRAYATEEASTLSSASPPADSTPTRASRRSSRSTRSTNGKEWLAETQAFQRPSRSSFKALVQEGRIPHLMSLADLSTTQIQNLLRGALAIKYVTKELGPNRLYTTLDHESIALIFSKRSTRTRVAAETATKLLAGNAMFLGSSDIQLGVNETLKDSAKVISSMVDGIFARVGAHEEIEELAQHSVVPVVNALSDLYHPTQILADLLTLQEHYTPLNIEKDSIESNGRRKHAEVRSYIEKNLDPTACLKGKKVAWVGDTNNISNELLVTLPRFGAHFAIASPKGYDTVDPRVWAKVEEAQTTDLVTLTNSPEEALKDADVVVTDTWISMGQETEKAARLAAFKGYQITNQMVESAGANPDWKFLHCLPRKAEEVDDEVFYGPRSLAFPEAENRKWTIAAVFDAYFGRWSVDQ